MLKALRNKTLQKKIYLVLIVLILPAFLIWGVNLNEEGASASSPLAKLGNKNITVQQYLRSYQAVQHQVDMFYGNRAREFSRYLNIKGQAWDRLLLLDYAKKENIRVPDSEVVEWIGSRFSVNGKFDELLYKRYVEEGLRSNPREFEEEIRENLILARISDKLKANISLSDEELKQQYQAERAKKDVVYGFVSWESQSESVKVADEELEKIYAVVKDNLTDPEKVRIEYLFVPKDASDSAKKALAEKDAAPAELSQKYGLTLQNTRLFSKKDVMPEIGSQEVIVASFTLPAGQSSEWLETDKGSYKIKVLEKIAERKLSFQESKQELSRVMIRDSATKEALKKLQAVKMQVSAAGTDFEAVLEKNSIPVQKADGFESGSPSAPDGGSGAFENSVKSLKEGEISEPFAVPGGAIIVKVVKEYPGDASKFEEEKTEFRERAESKKLDAELQKLLETLRNRLTLNLEVMKQLFPEEPAKN